MPATANSQTLCTMPRDKFCASNIGTFACRTFPRDTKASKRAKTPTMNQRLINIIKNYKRRRETKPDSHLTFCENQNTLDNAIYFAAIAKNGKGKKHGHQKRLKKKVLAKYADNLLERKRDIKRVKTFDQLYAIATESANKGIGKLTIYDTAHRISKFLNVVPDKIYLHAGTKAGAKKLLGQIGRMEYITKLDLPKEFQIQDLTEEEIEDILCIYKKLF
jgi:hypothetical protein